MEIKEFKIGDWVLYRDNQRHEFGTGKIIDMVKHSQIEVFPPVVVYKYFIIDDNTKQVVIIINNGKDGVVEDF